MDRKEYKKTMSGIHPSEQAIERIMDMTNRKRSSKNVFIKKIVSATLAFAILVGSGVGINQFVSNKEPVTNTPVVQSNINPLSVMVAYAGEYKPISEIKAGSKNEQQIFYSIHYADIENKDDVNKAKALFDKDKNDVLTQVEALGNEGFTASGGSGSGGCWSSEKDKETGILYTVRGGSFALDLDDYSNVKTFTVENSGKYGTLVFDCKKTWNTLEDDVANNGTGLGIMEGNKFSFTGAELKESQDSKTYEGGTKHIVNKGYNLNWEPSDELYNSIGNDLNFDLSQIKDTITFTVEFNDGTVQTAILNLYFDSDGYMHFE